jgi:hypothetical protein
MTSLIWNGRISALADECPETQGRTEGMGNWQPKARLRKHGPRYKETSDGPTLLAKIGIPAIRERCPHFAGWLTRLEALAESA